MEDLNVSQLFASSRIDVRPDRETAAKVQEGIAIQRAFGTVAAAKFLRQRRIDVNVAVRVLTRPHWRRMP